MLGGVFPNHLRPRAVSFIICRASFRTGLCVNGLLPPIASRKYAHWPTSVAHPMSYRAESYDCRTSQRTDDLCSARTAAVRA